MSRIIAGSAKGRRVTAPSGDRTRPTTDRTREALFSALVSWFGNEDAGAEKHLGGVRMLDLYAGSGAIGLEALSRGAARAVAVEAAKPVVGVIKNNGRELKLPIEVIQTKLPSGIANVSGEFDLVFIDPPYDVRGTEVDALLEGLATGGRLAPKALVVVERDKRSDAPNWPKVFTDAWSRHYGETSLHFASTD